MQIYHLSHFFQVFSNEDVLKPLTGVMGVGHTRYSTAGRNVIENIQPVILQTYHGPLVISQNGNLTTHKTLRSALLKSGYHLHLMFRN